MFVILGLPVMLVGLLFFVVWLEHRGKSQKRGAYPTCGQCRYPVRGLTTFTCPECGMDLREVGIIPADKPLLTTTKTPMPAGGPVSKTATILLTDMKDYTARSAESSRDDALTLLRRHRELVTPPIQRRIGKVVKTTGDGIIAVFDSATDALLAAIEVQSVIALHNQQSFSDGDKFQLRIAVSTGEIALTDNDVFGNPVNLASRIQQFAQPGEVYFTDSTYHAINRREVSCEPAGPVEVKGLEGKINLFRCLPRSTTSADAC